MPGETHVKGRRNGRGACLVAVAAVVVGGFGLAGTSSAGVEAVTGSAFGYFASDIRIFGTLQPAIGPEPIATLPPGGSANEEAEAETGSVRYGPGIFFTSGLIRVGTQGMPGPEGQVQSLVSIFDVPQSNVKELIYAGQITADCIANELNSPEPAIGQATFSGPGDPAAPNPDVATLLVSDGDSSVEGDETYYEIPLFPEPNTVVNGEIQDGETYQVILNEQTFSADGAITVTAAHIRFLGPIVTGDLYIGQVTCGVTSTGTTTTSSTTAPTTTSTTTPPPAGPTCGGLAATIVGTPDRDRLTGTDGPDVIVGLGGDDMIEGGDGDDVICAGAGNDTVIGGAGDDTVNGGDGDDRLVGSSGRDDLRGGAGLDSLGGGSGNDSLNGGPDADTCEGGTGTNTFAAC